MYVRFTTCLEHQHVSLLRRFDDQWVFSEILIYVWRDVPGEWKYTSPKPTVVSSAVPRKMNWHYKPHRAEWGESVKEWLARVKMPTAEAFEWSLSNWAHLSEMMKKPDLDTACNEKLSVLSRKQGVWRLDTDRSFSGRSLHSPCGVSPAPCWFPGSVEGCEGITGSQCWDSIMDCLSRPDVPWVPACPVWAGWADPSANAACLLSPEGMNCCMWWDIRAVLSDWMGISMHLQLRIIWREAQRVKIHKSADHILTKRLAVRSIWHYRYVSPASVKNLPHSVLYWYLEWRLSVVQSLDVFDTNGINYGGHLETGGQMLQGWSACEGEDLVLRFEWESSSGLLSQAMDV